jgi:excisionase family DNA binding protein
MDDTGLNSHQKQKGFGALDNQVAATRELPKDNQEFLDTEQTCNLLGVHRNTLYRLIQTGDIPALKLAAGGRWRFRRQELLDWVEARKAGRLR